MLPDSLSKIHITTQKYYKQITYEDLLSKQYYNNVQSLPKINKISLNTTSNRIVKEIKWIFPCLTALEMITGQKLKRIVAKKSIATFKLRKKQLIGCTVTLRGERMIGFFEKFIKIILPRLRDFRKLNPLNFDYKGNYNCGLNPVHFFPELENFFEFFDHIAGFDISINTSTTNLEEARLFLSSFQIPTELNNKLSISR